MFKFESTLLKLPSPEFANSLYLSCMLSGPSKLTISFTLCFVKKLIISLVNNEPFVVIENKRFLPQNNQQFAESN